MFSLRAFFDASASRFALRIASMAVHAFDRATNVRDSGEVQRIRTPTAGLLYILGQLQ